MRRRMPAGRPGAVATLLLAAAALLGGCSAAAPAASTGLPDGVTVELRQLRSDVADRTAQVRVTNGTAVALEVDRVEFADPRFDGVAVRERRSTIAAGRTVDLRIELPPSDCDAAGEASGGRIVLVLGDGTARGAAVADPLGFVPPLHERECVLRRASETAELAWTDFRPGEAAGALVLAVRPAGGAHGLELVEVRETNLLQFPDAARSFPLDLTIDPAGEAFEVEVPLVPARCDAHAVQEDKRGTVFTLAVRLDGADGTIDLAAGEVLRGEVLAWVGQVCGFPAG